MITCYLVYEIDPDKLADFEDYARLWLDLVPRFGGTHHGYFLPHEGRSDEATALFSFPSLADYERYRTASASDAACQSAYQLAKDSRCIRRYTRTFLRPVLSSNRDPDGT